MYLQDCIAFVMYTPPMMAQDGSKSTWEPINYIKFISQSQPDIITSIWQLERIKAKICRQKMSILFNQMS